MRQLYVIGVGGSVPKSNIEVHDIQFITADSFEATHDILKNNWYGESLHVDSYGVLSYADGYTIQVCEPDAIDTFEPSANSMKLYFVFLGGYNKDIFGELHEFGFVVATSIDAAKKRAMERYMDGVAQKHVDEIRQIDLTMIDVEHKKLTLKLISEEGSTVFKPEWNGYLKLIPRKKY